MFLGNLWVQTSKEVSLKRQKKSALDVRDEKKI